MLHLHAVVANEAMSSVVEAQAVLPTAVARLVRAQIRSKTKVGTAELSRRPLGMHGQVTLPPVSPLVT